jgi:hypothetical protein
MAGWDTDGRGGCESSHDTGLGSGPSGCDIPTDRSTDNAGHTIDSNIIANYIIANYIIANYILFNRASDPSCGDDATRDNSRC